MVSGTQNQTEIMLLFLAVGDFNNDGKPDLVGSLQYDAGASVLLNTGATLAATITTISPSAPQSYSAFQSVTFTAQIQHTGPQMLTGTVQFLDSGVSIGSASVNSSGQASLTTTSLAVGAHFIVGYYQGDTNFAPSNSLGVHVTMNKAGTTLALASSTNPSTLGQSVTFTATITPQYAGQASGTVTFNDGATALGSGAVSANAASLTTSSLAIGTHPITAVYTGDSNFSGSTSPVFSIVIVAQLTVTTTSLPGGTIDTAYNQTTLQASGGTGPYTWSVATGSLAPGLSLNSGGGISGTPTTAGTFDLTVMVTDAQGLTATSGLLSTAVVPPPNAPICLPPTVTAGANPLSVTAESQCTDSQSTVTSTTIDWGDGTAPSSGISAQHPYAKAGSYTITVTATNANDLNNTGSGSVTVTAPLTTSVPQGQSAPETTYYVTAPLGVPSVQVTYQCAKADGPNGKQDLSVYHLSCNINSQGSTATVTLSSTSTAVSIKVQTNSDAALQSGWRSGRVEQLYALLLLLPGIAWVGTGFCRQGRRRVGRYAILAVLALLAWGCLACGGGSSMQTAPPPQGTTPTGTYGVTVTGTSTGGSAPSGITIGFTVTIGG
jgi:PKD repeat protein